MTAFCIRHPIFTTVLNGLIVLMGLLCWHLLPLGEYPHVERPELAVHAFYPNASAELIEVAITNPLEDLLAGVEGIKSMSSSSRTGHTTITLKFNEGTSLDRAMTLVRDAIALSRDRLPKDAKEPVIQRGGSQEDWPFMAVSLSSPTLSAAELTHFANLNLKNAFRSLKGVAAAEMWGQPYAITIRLDSKKMKSFGISCHDIIDAFEKAQLPLPAGKFQEQDPITFDLTPKKTEDFESLVIRNHKQQDVLLKYIATVKLETQTEDHRIHVNGKPGVVVAIRKAKDANPLDVADAIKKEMDVLRQQISAPVTLDLVLDQSTVIYGSLASIRSTFIEAVIFVFLIIIMFLGNWRSAIIPLVTIPLSIIGSFLFYVIIGLSLNVLTFLAMVLAIGLVVDDAIVVLENIHRHKEKGLSSLDAALQGSREIVFPIIAMTLTLASVYAPIAFVKGVIGSLFLEFSIALAGAVIVSGFVALTLSPMMCSRLLTSSHSSTKLPLAERYMPQFISFYQRALNTFFQLKPAYLGAGALIGFLALVLIYSTLPSEISPKEDRGIIGAYIAPLPGKGMDTLESYVEKIEQKLGQLPETESTQTFMGSWGASVVVSLKDWSKRSRHSEKIREILQKEFSEFPTFDVECWAWQSGLPGLDTIGQPSTVGLILQSNQSYSYLFGLLENLRKSANDSKFFENNRHNLKLNTPAYRINPHWQNLADVGVDPKKISQTLEVFQGGIQHFDFLLEGVNYPIIIKGAPKPWSLDELYVFNSKGKSISLGAILSIQPSVLPKELNHFNQMRSATFYAELKPKETLSDGMNKVQQLQKDILPNTVKT